MPFVAFCKGPEIRSYSGALLARARNDQSVILLQRDPRDVTVSFYHHLRERATRRELLRKRVPDNVRQLDLYDFMLHPEFGVQRVVDHYNSWLDQIDGLERTTFISYEALWNDAQEELRRVMRALGNDPPDAIIQSSVEFASFSSLQEKERSGFFQGERLKPVTAGDKQALKVRQGGINGYRRLFAADQVTVIDKIVTERLDPSFGYGPVSHQMTEC